MFVRDKIKEGSKYLRDGSSLKGYARNVITPFDETELREGIRYSNKGNTKVTISGNRTGISGGASPCGGDVMAMEYLSGVLGFGHDEKGVFVRAMAGTSVSDILESIGGKDREDVEEFEEGAMGLIDDRHLQFPVKVLPASSLGGCIAENRSGIRTFVRRIKVVFADSTFTSISRGECVADGRRMMFSAGRNFFAFEIPHYDSKDDFGPRISSGMDLVDLFVGSEGLFGIITEADIYLSEEVADRPTQQFGKLNNKYIQNTYGKSAAEDLRRIKSILDPNYILSIGNMI